MWCPYILSLYLVDCFEAGSEGEEDCKAESEATEEDRAKTGPIKEVRCLVCLVDPRDQGTVLEEFSRKAGEREKRRRKFLELGRLDRPDALGHLEAAEEGAIHLPSKNKEG